MDESKIIVAHVVGKWHGGGVESVVMNYYKYINKKNIQFHFICDADSTKIPYDAIERLGGKVILVTPYQKIFKYILELKKIFTSNNYKIVHSHINTLSIFPLFSAFLAGVPIRIAHAHSETNKKEYIRNIIKNFLKIFSKVFSNRYFSCSQKTAIYQFGRNILDNSNFYLIYNAIELERFKFDKKERAVLRDYYNISDDTIVLGNIGRIIEQKNQIFLLDILKEISIDKNVILFIIGDGPLKIKLIEKAKELEISEKVVFLGYINNVSKYYNMFDVFCLPSLYEGFPVVGVETQANSLPTIFSKEVTRDIKLQEQTYFLSINNGVDSWIKCISNINNRNIEKNALSDKYDIIIQAKELEKIYFKLWSDLN